MRIPVAKRGYAVQHRLTGSSGRAIESARKISLMALMKCSGCGEEVSDQAAVCPTCGAPLTPIPDSVRSKRTGGVSEGIGFALVALGIVVGLVSNRVLGSVMALAGVVVFLIGRRK